MQLKQLLQSDSIVGQNENACMDADLSSEAMAKYEARDKGIPLGNIAALYGAHLR
jgi:hypothetical protein